MANPFYNYFQQAEKAYGTSASLLSNIAKLESGFRPGVMNNWDSNAKAGTPSGGLMQFIRPTFNSFAQKAKAANPAAWQGVKMDWMNPQAQVLAAGWAMANGLGSHWATYNKAKGMGGGERVNLPHQVSGSAPAGMTGGPDSKKLTQISQAYWNNPAMMNRLVDREYRRNPYKPAESGHHAGDGHDHGAGGGFGAPGIGSVKLLPRKDGELGWQYLQRLGRNLFGLSNDPGNSQTTGGRHSTHSHHYSGRAIDFGDARNSWQQLNKWYAWLNKNRKRLGIVELLNEGDHIHAAIR